MFGRTQSGFTNSLKMPHNFLLSCVFGHPVPFTLLSIYIHLCLLSIFCPVSTKISCIFQSLSHTPSLPWSPSWPHLSNHRHDTFTASNVPRSLRIFLRPTSQGWIYPQFICGVILLTYFAQLLSHKVTSHPGLPRIELWIFSGKTRLRSSSRIWDFQCKSWNWVVSQDAKLSMLKPGDSWTTYWELINW